jgi:hypothetical protein
MLSMTKATLVPVVRMPFSVTVEKIDVDIVAIVSFGSMSVI